MKDFLLLVALLVASAGVHAEGSAGKYWVVGSFRNLGNARVERLRLQKSLGESVRIADVDRAGGTLYRLVVAEKNDATKQKQHFKAIGISPWPVAPGADGLDFINTDNDTAIEYTLVVGSFATETKADSFSNKMRDLGFAMVNTMSEPARGEIRYFVTLGPYEKRFAAIKDRVDDSGIAGAWWRPVAVKSLKVE